MAQVIGAALRLLLLAASAWLAACSRPAGDTFRGPTMGTTYSVQVVDRPGDVDRERLQSTIDTVLAEVDAHLSTYDASSEISRFNASLDTAPVRISIPFAEVLATAFEVHAASGGAFDVTVGPLVRAWGFGAGATEIVVAPDEATLAAARALVGQHKLRRLEDGRALAKSVPGIRLDVDGVAPGYAVDELARRFEALGVLNYLVEIGGEVRARGKSPAGREWRVAVEAPVAGERRPYTLVALDGLAVSTSGDYRDDRIVGGRRISHTIDPRSGAPVTHGLASVSVVHASAAAADAWATALMVLGPEEGFDLADRLGLAALFIERAPAGGRFEERSTPAFERLRRRLD